jgi:flavin reductase (DIM6/NTAB) family NADH-FMN oxidoreductase RutF
MTIDPTQTHPRDIYLHMVSFITPRPIAWVSTINREGQTNLAPFSFFNGVCPNPPTILFCPTNSRHGKPKDTLRNIEATREFVVNVVPDAIREKMNATSEEFPPEVSEFAACGLASVPSIKVKPPRVKESPVNLECVLHDIIRIGEGPLSGNIVIGRIVMIHADDSVLDESGQIDPAKLDTIGRMGGSIYTRTRERFEMDRPDRK